MCGYSHSLVVRLGPSRVEQESGVRGVGGGEEFKTPPVKPVDKKEKKKKNGSENQTNKVVGRLFYWNHLYMGHIQLVCMKFVITFHKSRKGPNMST